MERTSNAMCHEWRPKHGVMFMITLMAIIAVIVALIVWSSVSAYAQGVALKNEPAFDVKSMLTMLLPAIWSSIGPIAIAAITKGVNGIGTRIPRPVQVVLSSVLGAASGALADGGAVMAVTAVSGAASQLYAQAQPSTFLTTEKPR
jgi:hypothetical protein